MDPKLQKWVVVDSDKLQTLIEHQGQTKLQLAKLAGISRSLLHVWTTESMYSRASPAKVKTLAKALGCDEADFLYAGNDVGELGTMTAAEFRAWSLRRSSMSFDLEFYLGETLKGRHALKLVATESDRFYNLSEAGHVIGFCQLKVGSIANERIIAVFDSLAIEGTRELITLEAAVDGDGLINNATAVRGRKRPYKVFAAIRRCRKRNQDQDALRCGDAW